MLILTRRAGESLRIGQDVEIKVCGLTRSGEAKLAITAPKSVLILRTELLERIAREQSESQALSSSEAIK